MKSPVPILREQLPKHLAEKVVDVIRLERGAGEGEILQATLELLQRRDGTTDAELVEELITQWRSGGLGVAGPEATLQALSLGQVDQLLISGRFLAFFADGKLNLSIRRGRCNAAERHRNRVRPGLHDAGRAGLSVINTMRQPHVSGLQCAELKQQDDLRQPTTGSPTLTAGG